MFRLIVFSLLLTSTTFCSALEEVLIVYQNNYFNQLGSFSAKSFLATDSLKQNINLFFKDKYNVNFEKYETNDSFRLREGMKIESRYKKIFYIVGGKKFFATTYCDNNILPTFLCDVLISNGLIAEDKIFKKLMKLTSQIQKEALENKIDLIYVFIDMQIAEQDKLKQISNRTLINKADVIGAQLSKVIEFQYSPFLRHDIILYESIEGNKVRLSSQATERLFDVIAPYLL